MNKMENISCDKECMDSMEKFSPLFKKIESMTENACIIFAIEGCCGSGKTTLAKYLQGKYDCNVFHMDDFFLQPYQRTKERFEEVGGNVDRERFLEEVLIPLKRGMDIRYKRFDCKSLTLQPEVVIEHKRINIVEGSYSMHPLLADYYDFGVFLSVDCALQKKRIEKRNSIELTQRFFDTWIPMEEKYHKGMRVKERCSLHF